MPPNTRWLWPSVRVHLCYYQLRAPSPSLRDSDSIGLLILFHVIFKNNLLCAYYQVINGGEFNLGDLTVQSRSSIQQGISKRNPDCRIQTPCISYQTWCSFCRAETLGIGRNTQELIWQTLKLSYVRTSLSPIFHRQPDQRNVSYPGV